MDDGHNETELELRLQEACYRCESELPASELETTIVSVLSDAERELRRLRGLFDAIRSIAGRGLESYPHSTIQTPPWAHYLQIMPKQSNQIWVRWTGADGIYRWLHAAENRWVEEPEQIAMPLFTNYGRARLAARRSPEPPTWQEFVRNLAATTAVV